MVRLNINFKVTSTGEEFKMKLSDIIKAIDIKEQIEDEREIKANLMKFVKEDGVEFTNDQSLNDATINDNSWLNVELEAQ